MVDGPTPSESYPAWESAEPGPLELAIMSEPAPDVQVQPAATVMLVRDAGGRRGGSLEVLMLRRHPESVFAPDAWVFPGGRVDEADGVGIPIAAGPSDAEASRALEIPSGGLAYWVAAARECFEEAGILLARHPNTGGWLEASNELVGARFARHRRDVHSGAASLGEVLRAEGLELDLSGVHYVSHWITPPGRTARRFDTRFFVAECPPSQPASHDAAETVDSIWTTPAEALSRGAAGEIQLLRPTIANLKALARFSSVAEIGELHLPPPSDIGELHQPPPRQIPESACPT